MLWMPRAESSSVDAIETLGINSFWAWLGFLRSTVFRVLPAVAVRMWSFLLEASCWVVSGCPTKHRSSLEELGTWHSTALHNSPTLTHPFTQLWELFCARSSLGDVETSFLHPLKFSSCSWEFKYVKNVTLGIFFKVHWSAHHPQRHKVPPRQAANLHSRDSNSSPTSPVLHQSLWSYSTGASFERDSPKLQFSNYQLGKERGHTCCP